MFLKHDDKKGRTFALRLKSLLLVGGPFILVFFIFSFEENLENLNEL